MKKVLITVAAVATTAFGVSLFGTMAHAMTPQQPEAEILKVGEDSDDAKKPEPEPEIDWTARRKKVEEEERRKYRGTCGWECAYMHGGFKGQ